MLDPFAGLRLERSGTISRGVIGGSNRDVNIESGLRLHVHVLGDLAGELQARAPRTCTCRRR